MKALWPASDDPLYSPKSKSSTKKYYVLSPDSTKDRAAFGEYKGMTLAANKAYIAQ